MASLFDPDVPAGAYEDLMKRVLPFAHEQKVWEPADGPMPSLFVSHGAPFTLDDPVWMDDLYRWGSSMPKPRAIIVVSAHWESAPVAISGTAASTPLYYDFGGFHPKYYTLKYATPDSSDLARRLAGVFASTTAIHRYTDRGLDHGAYIPLMAMYPAADVPVVQLSMPSLDPSVLFDMGVELRAMRDEGILIIGSGFMTHNSQTLRNPDLVRHTEAFDTWVSDAVARGDIDSLTDFAHRAPGVHVAHPTHDHFVPLLLTLGAADDPRSAISVIDRMFFGNSIRSMQVA